jgi:exodeoxyribonuclease VIII
MLQIYKKSDKFANVMQYHTDISRVSKSGLDLINRAPALYYERYLNPNASPQKETPALIIGSAAHCAVFEPAEFGKRYAVAPHCDRRTKEGKEIWANFLEHSKGLIPLDAESATMVERIMESVRGHRTAQYLLKDGIAEAPIFWNDEETEVDCKARPDWLTPDNVIIDLKTTEDASPRGFAQSVKKYRYDVQAAFYSDGLEEATGKPCNGFFFVAVEKHPPYLVGWYFIGNEDLKEARQKYKKNLMTYGFCKKSGIWHGYSEIVTKVIL